ncbi:MAG: twin-arginine translocation signal domain-containing protein [Silicimonas sp.]|nr:twin-arginine translocation signal domain-containing protein [Silicimonas sp.]
MLTRRSFLAATAVLPAAGLIATPALAAEPPVYATDGIAINGYDPVAYFTMSKPVEGEMAHASDWEGVKVLFSSAEHKVMFDADPETFAPKYGGYCAYAVSNGYTATTSPSAWSVYEGRLYLNYNRVVRGLWSRDKAGHVAKADANWPGVLA